MNAIMCPVSLGVPNALAREAGMDKAAEDDPRDDDGRAATHVQRELLHLHGRK